jgi:Putative auto-transporter adhesin, head GIN domain
MRKTLLIAVLALFVITSCRVFGKRIKGNGTIATDARVLSGFHSVNVSGSIDIYIKQDSSSGVKVITDSNLFEYIETKEEGGILYVDVKGNYNLKPTDNIKVYVSAPLFRKLSASGACDIYSEGMVTGTESIDINLSGSSDAALSLKAPKVTADLTGAGSLKLNGETKDLELDGTGSSTLKCAEMMAENVVVEITGSGNAEVFASVSLDIDVTGSGTVKYKGTPSVNQKISGSGTIKKLQ